MSENEKTWHKGGCHCGAVRFEVEAAPDVVITDCNCSVCSMTGFQHLFVAKAEFNLLSGQDDLTTYTFGSHTAQHYFCKTCGIKSFYIPRSHPNGYSVNLRCIDQSKFTKIEFEPFDGGNWEKNIAGLVGEA
jgi:hypothetical protein